jgi:autotransporter translocation and assembly factor TamB
MAETKIKNKASILKRLLKATLIGLASLIIGFVGALILVDSSAGRDYAAQQIEQALSNETMQVEVGNITGSLLSDFSVDYITARDVDGVLWGIQDVDISWAPSGLLKATLEVDSITLERGAIYRLLTDDSVSVEETDTPISLPTLPIDINLRSLNVGRFDLSALSSGDTVISLTSKGFELTEQSLDVALEIRELESAKDNIKLDLHHSVSTGDVRLRANITSNPDGLIAGILDLKEKAVLDAKAEGSITNWNGQAELRLGDQQISALTFGRDMQGYHLDGSAYLSKARSIKLPDFLHEDFDFELVSSVSKPLHDIKLDVTAVGLVARFQGDLITDEGIGFQNTGIHILIDDSSHLAGAFRPASIKNIELNGALSGSVQTPDASLKLKIASPKLENYRADTIWAELLSETTPSGLQIRASGYVDEPNMASVQDIEKYIGTRIDFSASGLFNAESGAVNVEQLALQSNRFRQRLTGQILPNGCIKLNSTTNFSDIGTLTGVEFAGRAKEVKLGLDIDQPMSCDTFNVAASLSLPDMPSEYAELQNIVGNTVTLNALVEAPSTEKLSIRQFELRGANSALQIRGIVSEQVLDLAYMVSADNVAEFLVNQGIEATGGLRLEGNVKGKAVSPIVTANLEPVSVELQDIEFRDIELKGLITVEGNTIASKITVDGHSDLGPLSGALNTAISNGRPISVNKSTFSLGDFTIQTDRLTISEDVIAGVVSGSGDLRTLNQNSETSFGLRDIRLDLTLASKNKLQGIDMKASVGNGYIAGNQLPSLVIGVDGSGDEYGYTLEILELTKRSHKVSMTGQVVFNDNGEITNQFALSGEVGAHQIHSSKPITSRAGDGYFALDIPGLKIGDGEINALLSSSDTTRKLDVKAQHIPLSLLTDFMPSLDVNGTISFEGNLNQEREVHSASFNMHIANLNRTGSEFKLATGINAGITGTMVSDILNLDGWFGTDSINQATLDMRLPLKVSEDLLPVIDLNGPMESNIALKQDVEVIWKLFALQDDELKGALNSSAQITGTLAAPKIAGKLSLSDGHYENIILGLIANNVDIDIGFTEQKIQINRATANDGSSGALAASGVVEFTPDYDLANSSFQLNLDKYALVRRADAEATVTADLRLEDKTDAKGVILAGDLSVDRADFLVPEQLPSTITPLEVIEINGEYTPKLQKRATPTSKTPPVYLSLSAKAPRRFFVRGRGLDSEWSGNLSIAGTTEKPAIAGTIDLVGGSFAFAGKSFTLQSGNLFFDGSIIINPLVQFAAQYKASDIEARLEVAGRLDNPRLTLSATPSLPQDEILSRILFGSSVTELSSIQLLELASALSSLSGQGNFDAVGTVRRFVGLDRLTLENGLDDEGSIIGGGKYLTNNVFLSLSTATGTGETAAEIEVDITKNLSLKSRLDPSRDNSLSIRWSWDF